MYAFSGFNGFGQFGGNRQRSENGFTDICLEKIITERQSTLFIAVSWSYTAYAIDNQLALRGFISSTPNSTVCVETAERITQLAAGDRFCLVLCKNGKLFKIRPESDAKLEEVKLEVEVQSLPQKRSIFGEPKSAVKQEKPLHVTHIACGSNITAAVSATNAVYSVPSKIHQFPKHFRVRQLLCGFEHALLLSANGDIYSWGNGFRGQLGQDVLRVEEVPMLIEALAGIKISFIAAGGWHSAAISTFGDIYTWGFNSNGQLGLRMFKTTAAGNIKQPTVFTLPQIVELPECHCLQANDSTIKSDEITQNKDATGECQPVRVYAGARHTLLQMNCGTLCAAGWNVHGQLGIEHKMDYCDEFVKITSVKGKVEMNIVCGAWCTVVSKNS